MLATRLRWLSITGLGSPEVPDENGRHATWVAGSIVTAGGSGGVPTTADQRVCPPASASASPITTMSDAASPAPPAAAATWGSRAAEVMTIRAETAPSCRSISGAG